MKKNFLEDYYVILGGDGFLGFQYLFWTREEAEQYRESVLVTPSFYRVVRINLQLQEK